MTRKEKQAMAQLIARVRQCVGGTMRLAEYARVAEVNAGARAEWLADYLVLVAAIETLEQEAPSLISRRFMSDVDAAAVRLLELG